LLLINYM